MKRLAVASLFAFGVLGLGAGCGGNETTPSDIDWILAQSEAAAAGKADSQKPKFVGVLIDGACRAGQDCLDDARNCGGRTLNNRERELLRRWVKENCSGTDGRIERIK